MADLIGVCPTHGPRAFVCPECVRDRLRGEVLANAAATDAAILAARAASAQGLPPDDVARLSRQGAEAALKKERS